jgi:hypothetical protein
MLRLSLIFCISLTFSDVFSASGDPEIEFRSSSKEISEISQQPLVQLFNPDTIRRRLLKLEMDHFLRLCGPILERIKAQTMPVR